MPFQAARVRKEEKAFRVQVEASYGNDARKMIGQRLEHRWPAGVVARARDQPGGLVVPPKPNRFRGLDWRAVQHHGVAFRNLDGRSGDCAAVYGHPPVENHPLGLPARSDARPRQEFGDSGARAFGVVSRLRHGGESGCGGRINQSLPPPGRRDAARLHCLRPCL